jgi:hypothetical protein
MIIICSDVSRSISQINVAQKWLYLNYIMLFEICSSIRIILSQYLRQLSHKKILQEK